MVWEAPARSKQIALFPGAKPSRYFLEVGYQKIRSQKPHGCLPTPRQTSRISTTRRKWQDCTKLHLPVSQEGDSTTSLGNLFQCSVTLKVKKFFTVSPFNKKRPRIQRPAWARSRGSPCTTCSSAQPRRPAGRPP